MSEETTKSIEQAFALSKDEIDTILASAAEIIDQKVAPVDAIMTDIKKQIAHGTDRIPTSQFHQWAMELSVATSELTPFRDAYSLASALWKIDISKSNAKSIAQRRAEQKKAEVENQNVIDTADKETQKAILDYMSGRIRDVQDNIYQMCSELNRVIDSRNRFGENK